MLSISKLFSFLLLSVFCISANAQGYIPERLSQKMEDNPETFFTVRIEFKDNVDCSLLKSEFENKGIDPRNRARIINRRLMLQASRSQSDLLHTLKTKWAEKVKNIYPFWIVNMIVLEAKPELIREIARRDNILLIDLEEGTLLFNEPLIEGGKAKISAPNGTEPGLAAINAPAMWKLGYTGRGRLVYNYDTGVWPSHPSFSDRFMANFFPLSQSWLGFFGQSPNGGVSDHGTHTLGTMAGLDPLSNDTIGVAFGAYWIANDFVTSTVGGLPPIVDMVGAFQWSLNPDGDTSTTSDIPDVINNSWRWYDAGDTLHCGGYIVNLMNAIEAAGIANVFSGGNMGPGNTTISSPQRINASKTNTFSVGSVDGNQPFPHPISSFSSRGPTQCPGSGALKIHPEVVAPGQNVRSAWGRDSYNTISGTSMAAPHVSGAVLLLKEAFPNLTGDQLLNALYTSAIDMGISGEDNTFGNGLIDVYAAYQFLAQTNTPVDPAAIAWDLAISDLTGPALSGITCLSNYNPQITIQNKGDSAITQIAFSYKMGENGNLSTYTWTGSLPGGQSVNISLPAINFTSYGSQELIISAAIPNTASEYDLINNNRRVRFDRRETLSLPFLEGFEDGISSDWYINNEDGAIGWDTLLITGRTNNDVCLGLNFYDYQPRSSQKDELISPVFQIPTGSAYLNFDLSYQRLNTFSQLQDTLRVYASTDCGASFPFLLYEKFGADLSTYATPTQNFVPQSESHWRRDTIDLQSLTGQGVLFKFQGVNRKGNNLYLDNISVYTGSDDPVGNIEISPPELTISPNPVEQLLRIELSYFETKEPYALNIFNTNGQIVYKGILSTFDNIYSLEALSPGLYIIKVSGNRIMYTSKFIKK